MLRRSFRGHPMVKAAVEMGAWALWAEREGKSLSRLLGGTPRAIATGISIAIQDSPRALVDKARDSLARGYRKIKIRPGADIEYIGAVRKALGADAPLMADANRAYIPSVTRSISRISRLLPAGHDRAATRAGRSPPARPFAGPARDSHLPRRIDPARRRRRGYAGPGRRPYVNIKPGRVGGFAQALAIHDVCQHHAVPVWCGGMLESGIGRACNVALAALPNFTLPGDVSPSARYWTADIVTPEWTMDSTGMVTVPADRPGLGVTVDVDRVDDLTVRTRTLTAA